MIPAETVDLVIRTAVIEDVVGDYVELKKSGSSLRGLSPFTNEKTPSFYVLPEKGIFKCFSSDKGGSVVTFLMELEKLSFPQAIRQLADRYGIEIQETEESSEQQQIRSERESLLALNAWAQRWFSSQLTESKEGQAIGLSYFEERGFRADILDRFNIGYCPDSWDAMSNAAVEAGYNAERLLSLGLSKEREGKLWDFFKGRVMFPIRDVTGRTIAFGGRTLSNDKKVAKYFNSPESLLYQKGDVLFGMHLAKPTITKTDLVYLVEGYTDVMALHQAGIENVVSSSGTALTLNQIKLIRRYTKNVTVLFDGDAAGIRASIRGIDLLLAEGLNVQVVLFPDGDDPDSYSKKVSPSAFSNHLTSEAKDFVAFKLSLLTGDAATDPVKRSEMIHSILGSIAVIPDAIQQGVYLKLAAGELKMSEDVLQSEINKIIRNRLLEEQKAQKREEFRQRRDQVVEKEPSGLQIPADWNSRVAPIDGGAESIAPNEVESHRTIIESDLIRRMLRFSSIEVQPDMPGVEYEGKIPFAYFVIDFMAELGFEIKDPLLRKIYGVFEAFSAENKIPSLDDFLKNDDTEIQSYVVGALVDKHEVSRRWEEVHQIYSAREQDLLNKALMDSLHLLKLNENRREISEVQNQLEALNAAIEKGEEKAIKEMRELLERRKILDQQKRKITTYFGAAILP
ncbi:MAG: DNA primase [Flavobacteriales bacterium]